MIDFNDLENKQQVTPVFPVHTLETPPEDTMKSLLDSEMASGFYERLLEWINEFHKSLEDEYEAGACLVNFGQNIIFRIQDISYWNPALISFIGQKEDGSPVELIQHISQINVLLVKLRRKEPDKPKRPIGFRSWDDYEKEYSKSHDDS